MIKNNTLTDNLSSSPLQTVPHPLLNAILVSTLTTLLVYQLTSILYDISLGLRAKQGTTASALHTVLLIEDASSLSICAAIFRNDRIDRWRFRPNLPEGVTIDRAPNRVSGKTVFRLLFLLLLTPIISVLAVVLTLEFDRSVTFEQAGMKGLALVAGNVTSLRTFLPPCIHLDTAFTYTPARHADFTICHTLPDYVNSSTTAPSALYIDAYPDGMVQIIVYSDGNVKGTRISAGFVTGEKAYRLPHAMDEQIIEGILQKLERLLMQKCSVETDGAPDLRTWIQDGIVRGFTGVNCLYVPTPRMDELAHYMFASMTLTETESLVVAETDEEGALFSTFRSGSDLEVFVMRRNVVAVGILGIIVGCVTVLRIVVRLVTKNDVYSGLETLMKRFVGCESLLGCETKVRWGCLYQIGSRGWFGVEDKGLKGFEVERFGDGVSVGLLRKEDGIG